MIVVEEGEDWWSDRSSLYAFDPGVLQELLYSRYARSAYERRRRHRAVAVALEALIADDRPPPRLALLEIARHYEDAGDLPAAARRSSRSRSRRSPRAPTARPHSPRSVRQACCAALARSTSDEERQESERLLARAIVLLVLGGEPSWRAGTTEAARSGCSRSSTRPRAPPTPTATRRCARMPATPPRSSSSATSASMRASPSTAPRSTSRAGGDVVGEFAIQAASATTSTSVSLQEGWDVLPGGPRTVGVACARERLHDPAIVRERVRLETMIGVAAFDLGRYDEALELLVRCMDALRPSRRVTTWRGPPRSSASSTRRSASTRPPRRPCGKASRASPTRSGAWDPGLPPRARPPLRRVGAAAAPGSAHGDGRGTRPRPATAGRAARGRLVGRLLSRGRAPEATRLERRLGWGSEIAWLPRPWRSRR